MFRKIILVSVLIGLLSINPNSISQSARNETEIVENKYATSLEPIKDKNDKVMHAQAPDGYFYSIDFMDTYTSHGDDIEVSYSFPYLDQDFYIDVSYQGLGIETSITFNSFIASENFIFVFNCTSFDERVITLEFESNDVVQESYIYLSSDLTNDYISINSATGCRQQEFLYLLENELITEDEYNEFVYDDEEQVIIEEDDTTPGIGKPKRRQGNLNSDQISVSGTITWTDIYWNVYPARKMEVHIFDDNWWIFDSSLKTVYTDDNGYYSASITNNSSWPENGYDIYVKIVFANNNFEVYDYVQTYSYQLSTIENCKNGTVISNYDHNFDLSNNPNTRDSAISVFQAITYGFDYLNSIGAEREYLHVQFESWVTGFGASSFYTFQVNTICLNKKDQYNWDVILHEFGHFAADKEGLTDYKAANHRLNENLADTHGKWDGALLAWSEGWANYFSIAVSQKTSLKGLGILESGDLVYDNWNLESDFTNLIGEFNEMVIARLLWDLQDNYSSREPWDNISYGDKVLFQKIKSARPFSGRVQNLSRFVNFSDLNSNSTEIGEIFSYYNISPKVINSDKYYDVSKLYYFDWDAGGGSENHQNNEFVLNVMKMNGEIIFTKNVGSNTNYQMTQSDLNTILSKNVKAIKWNVTGRQYDSSGFTGPYLSKTAVLKLKENYQQTINVTDYKYKGQYFFYDQYATINLSNGFSFNTKRLRTGYIENEYLVMSAKRANAGTAYLEYNFDVNIHYIDFDISLWSAAENIYSSDSSIRLEYKNSSGIWVTKKEFDVNYMSTNRDNRDSYTIDFYDDIAYDIRFIVTTNYPTGSRNKGRVVLGNLNIHY